MLFARVLGNNDNDQYVESMKTWIASLDSLQSTTFRIPARKRKNRRSLSIPSQLHTLSCNQDYSHVPLRGLMSIVNQAADKSVDGACRQPCQSYCLAWGFPQQPLPPPHVSFQQQAIPLHHLYHLQMS